MKNLFSTFLNRTSEEVGAGVTGLSPNGESSDDRRTETQRVLPQLPSHLGSTVRKALIVFGLVMALVELTQARKNWYEGNLAKESERLVRIQEDRDLSASVREVS